MTAGDFRHTSVLLEESIAALEVKPDGIYVDATFGRGGHSKHILEQLSPQGRLLAFDRDPQAIAAGQRLQDQRLRLLHAPFSEMYTELQELHLATEIDGVLMDLGVSSPQLDDPDRGFSFSRDGALDMRMDPTRGISATEWLAVASEQEITDVLKQYGEERFGKRIAHAIVAARAEQPITSTLQLAKLIEQSLPVKDKHKHPATRSFQGIRIFINDELGEITRGLEAAVKVLKASGRLAVISFHSLEDRLVKRFLRRLSQGVQAPARLPLTAAEINATKVLNTVGKAIRPSAAEISNNSRARSSVLRVAEKR